MTGSAADVSRETRAPEPPDAARVLFGKQLPTLRAYIDLLASDGVVRGLVGPREVPRLWERHVLNCAVTADLIPAGAQVDDVGSGAGLPGIVLAVHRPDLSVTLVEPSLRRTVFLNEAVEALRLENVVVLRLRAEERARSRPGRDVVTARAVAPLERLAGWCLPLLKPGGVLLAIKGSTAASELTDAEPALGALGGVEAEILTVGVGVVDPPTTVIRVRRAPAMTVRAPKRRIRDGRSPA